MARAIGRFGEAMRDIAVHQYEIKTVADIAEARTMAQTLRRNYYNQRGDDPETWVSQWDQARNDYSKEINKTDFTPIAKKEILAEFRTSHEREAISIGYDAEKESFRINTNRLWDTVFKNLSEGNQAEALRSLDSIRKTGKYTEDYLQSRFKQIEGLAEVPLQQNMMITLRNEAKSFTTEDAAIDYIETKGLEIGLDRSDITWLRTAEKADRDRAKIQSEEAYDTKIGEIQQKLIDPNFDISTILQDPDIKGDDKTSLLSDYKAFSSALIPEESSFDAIGFVQTAIDDYFNGKRPFQYAYTTLKNNWKHLNSADRRKYQGELYNDDRVYSTHQSDGRYYLKGMLLTSRNAFGISIPAGPQEQEYYRQASIQLDDKLNEWRAKRQWPTPQDFYVEIQQIVNKVKGTNPTVIEKTTTEKEYIKTATNPDTGERIGWDGEKWEPIQ